MSRTRSSTSEARQRILETADRLFYSEGIRAVGIDRVIAEADVAKATLYAHFPSKDDLIVAVLRHREESVREFFCSAMEKHTKRGKSKLQAFFAALKEWFQSPDFRGCAFINAAIELADPKHPGTKFVREYKQRFRQMLDSFVEEAVGKAHARLTPAVAVLVEGACVTAVIHESAEPADTARDAALALVATTKGE
jgi:AcrR family transcriptional regulator